MQLSATVVFLECGKHGLVDVGSTVIWEMGRGELCSRTVAVLVLGPLLFFCYMSLIGIALENKSRSAAMMFVLRSKTYNLSVKWFR